MPQFSDTSVLCPSLADMHDIEWLLCLHVCVAFTDHHGLRLDRSSPDDKFQIAWLGVFNAKGQLENSVTGVWRLRCAHSTGRVRPHAWTQERCACEPHALLCDAIQRSSILLYECEFTEGHRLTTVSKTQVVEALTQQAPERLPRLPKSWLPKEVVMQDKKRGRGKSRKR